MVVVVIMQVYTSTWMMRAWWHARVWIMHHVERIVLLMGYAAVLVMNSVHVVMSMVRHVMCWMMVAVQVLVVVNELMVIIASIAKR